MEKFSFLCFVPPFLQTSLIQEKTETPGRCSANPNQWRLSFFAVPTAAAWPSSGSVAASVAPTGSTTHARKNAEVANLSSDKPAQRICQSLLCLVLQATARMPPETSIAPISINGWESSQFLGRELSNVVPFPIRDACTAGCEQGACAVRCKPGAYTALCKSLAHAQHCTNILRMGRKVPPAACAAECQLGACAGSCYQGACATRCQPDACAASSLAHARQGTFPAHAQ